MSWCEDSERTIPATPQRRAEARRQGRVPHSADLSAALALGGIALLLAWSGPALVTACGQWLWQSWANAPVLRADELAVAKIPYGPLLRSVVGLLASLWIMAITVRWLQVGPLWAPEIVQPRVERVSPLCGLRRLLSEASCVRGVMWLLRLLAAGGLVVWMLHSEAGLLANLPVQSPARLAVLLGEFTISFALRLCGVLLAFAAIDFGWQWWQHERDLRMTADERRSEQREAERRKPTSLATGRQEPQRRDTVRAGSPESIARI